MVRRITSWILVNGQNRNLAKCLSLSFSLSSGETSAPATQLTHVRHRGRVAVQSGTCSLSRKLLTKKSRSPGSSSHLRLYQQQPKLCICETQR